MDEMVDFHSQFLQKVEFEDLLVQLVKEYCNLILCFFLPLSRSIFSTIFQPILSVRLTLLITYYVPLFIGAFVQNLSTKLEKCKKNTIFSDFFDFDPRLTVLDQR